MALSYEWALHTSLLFYKGRETAVFTPAFEKFVSKTIECMGDLESDKNVKVLFILKTSNIFVMCYKLHHDISIIVYTVQHNNKRDEFTL